MNSEILKYLLPALIGVGGVLVGSLISLWANYLIKSRETALRIKEKIFDKKVKAYENLLLLTQNMRCTKKTKISDSRTIVKRYPACFKNKETFIAFSIDYNQIGNSSHFWIDVEIIRLIDFFKNYLIELSVTIDEIPEEQFMNVGILVISDFLKHATELENKVIKFFEIEIQKPNLKTRRGYHRFETAIYKQKMMDTDLKKNELSIINLK